MNTISDDTITVPGLFGTTVEITRDDRPWFLVRVDNHIPDDRLRLLREGGYEIYRPMERYMRLPPKRKLSASQRKVAFTMAKPHLRPLWVGYAFIRLPQSDPHALFQFAGIRGMAVTNGELYPIAAALIGHYKSLEVDGAIPGKTPIVEMLYKIGETVKMGDGAFTGFPATIEQLDEAGRVKLLVSVFGRATPVFTSIDQIDKL